MPGKKRVYSSRQVHESITDTPSINLCSTCHTDHSVSQFSSDNHVRLTLKPHAIDLESGVRLVKALRFPQIHVRLTVTFELNYRSEIAAVCGPLLLSLSPQNTISLTALSPQIR